MAYKYSGTCHTKCFWLDNLWKPGEVYEGDHKPNKHFNSTGVSPEIPPPTPQDDPRSNKEFRDELKGLGFTAPSKWNRKQLWFKIKELEVAMAKDALTNPEDKFFAKCGFQGKSQAGVVAHERSCIACKKSIEDEAA